LNSDISLRPRKEFPITERLTYLNSGGLGIIPISVQHRSHQFAQRLATEGTRAYFEYAEQVKYGPRRAGARLFNAEPNTIAIVNSVSEVTSQFAWWVRPRAHQNVVAIDIDHPSATFPWLQVSRETGHEVRFVRAAEDPASLSIEGIAALVDDNTAVISVSQVMWTSGHRFDLRQLADLAHAHGALLVIDATHGAGVVPIDAPASGADLIAAGAFKWLCGYSGVAVCYIRPGLMEQVQPLLVGHNNGTPSLQLQPSGCDATRIDLPPDATRMEYGSSSHVARYTLGLSIEYLLEMGIDRVEAHVQSLGTRLFAGLAALGAQVLTPLDCSQRAGIITARFPGHDGPEVVQALDALNVIVIPRLGGVRFTPHFFNNGADIDTALASVARIIGR